MKTLPFNVVTGAFGYTGLYITRRLLSLGERVKTITRRPVRESPFGDEVRVAAFDFSDPDKLVESLRGAKTLYNTYWVRFSRGESTFDRAVENTRTLIRSAREAGVRRIVHISITNPSEESPLPYFRGKAMVERAVMDSGLAYGIIRPTVVFGVGDILVNNIAWCLRTFPVLAIAGRGEYGVQPVFIEDVAELAVHVGGLEENLVVDAVGPDTFSFDEWVRLIAEKIQSPAKIIYVSPRIALFLARVIGFAVADVVLTRDELQGLMANLLVSGNPPTGHTRFSDWLSENADGLGTEYASELKRHFR